MPISPTSGHLPVSTDQTPIESSRVASDKKTKNSPISKRRTSKEHGDALTAAGRGTQADIYASIGVGTAALTRPKRSHAAYQTDKSSSTKASDLSTDEPPRTHAEQGRSLAVSGRSTQARVLAAQKAADSQSISLMKIPGARIERAEGRISDEDSVGIARFWDRASTMTLMSFLWVKNEVEQHG